MQCPVSAKLLDVKNLTIGFKSDPPVVDDVSFSVNAGETLALAAQPEPDINRPIDLEVVAKGAGDPAKWPEGFCYSATEMPPLQEVRPGHMVRCHA